MSWLSSFFHPERGYNRAQQELEKYFQQSQAALQPYNQRAQNVYEGLSDAMKNLLNPQELFNQWAGGYEESPAAKQAEELATQHGLNAASSMGLMGSSPALQAIQAGTSGISANDRENYLNRLMQMYNSGIGLGENIYGAGAGAASQLGQNAFNMGQNAAQLAYNQANAPGSMFGNLLGAGAGLLGSALGGPIGGALANRFIGPWTTGGS